VGSRPIVCILYQPPHDDNDDDDDKCGAVDGMRFGGGNL
jgi:hypothetical protein